jgi:hypothetical protein
MEMIRCSGCPIRRNLMTILPELGGAEIDPVAVWVDKY